jgi:hypothetical protein
MGLFDFLVITGKARGSANLTELRPASRAPSTPGLTPRWSYQAPGAVGGRTEYAGVHGGHGERP